MTGKDARIISLGLMFCFCSCATTSYELQQLPRKSVNLDVVYPRPATGDSIFVIAPLDSTFAFGSVRPPASRVFVNGAAAQVQKNGAFMAYFPLDTTNMQFSFLAVSPAGDSSRLFIPFQLRRNTASVLNKLPADSINKLLPARIIIKKKHAVVRTESARAYWMFPPCGSTALADSFAFPYFRIFLCRGLHAWIDSSFVSVDTCRRNPAHSVVNNIRVVAEDAWTAVHISLSQELLFKIEEQPEIGALNLDLFGANSAIDQIKYDARDSVIREIRWQQLQDDLLRLKIFLQIERLWGYKVLWQGSELVLKIRRPPELKRRLLRGRTIVLDAGHGGSQLGAIGPTRLAEKEANLQLALRLKELLAREGAQVYLTRGSDSTVDLYDRIDYAVEQNAEILLSLHNNALPDGENPFLNRGSSVYYYHPQSRRLARAIHQSLLQATGLQDFGLYYKNLALTRPAEMLCVLIELAFVIHPEEEQLLRDERFIDRAARGIVKGLKSYLKSCRKRRRNLSERFFFEPYPRRRETQLHYKPENLYE